MNHIASHLIAALISVVPLAGAATPAAPRPNILWITSEDNSSNWIGCYGNKQTKTPRIDALAKEGFLFENAYANAPVCAVARATILMGAYSPTMGTQHMRSRHPIPAKFRSISPFKPGERVTEPVSFVDLAPTLLSLAGLDTPAQMQGRPLLGAKRVEPAADEMEFLYADRFDELYGMRRGLTDGKWKYIRNFRHLDPGTAKS